MAEAIQDDHSPLARFLRQNDQDDNDEPAATTDARDTAADDSSPSTSHRPLPTTSSTPPQQPPQRSRRQVAAVERVKYAIATSALLSAKLADALQVYPPLDALEARQPAPRPDTTSSRPRSALKRPAKGKGKERAKAADWGSGWETRGQGVTERGVLGSAQAALSGLVGALGRLSTRVDHGSLESVVEEEEDAAQAPAAQGPATPQDALLATVEDFVAASQELDLRVATALTAIKELECIAHGLGLSDPLPPISRIEARGYLASPKPTSPTSAAMLSTPSRSPRIPSPLGGPSRASPPRTSDSESSYPPPLRALALRNALADALASALDALSTSTSALNALLPSDSPLLTLTAASTSMTPTSSQSHAPQASLSELLRHDSLARAERTEVSRWEEGSSAPSASSRPSSVHLPDGVDPFHPTESTFGGIDRRTGESGTPQRAAAGKQHRLRVSLGPHHGGGSGSGGGGASSSFEAVSPGGAGARRKRPVSMGGLDSLPPAPSAEQDRAGPSTATHRALLVTLQDRFDDVHDARRGVLWRLLESLDHAESDEAWLKAEAPLAALRAVLARAAADVARAHAREFPDAAAAASSPTSASTAASGSSAVMGPRAGAGTAAGAGVEAREKRRRSGYYGRPEADDLFPLSASSSSAPTWGAPPTPTPAARRPAAYADYAPSSAPPPPRRAAPHMHAPSVTAVDPTLSAHAQSMLLSLRAVQAKVRVVLADAAGARVGSATERERVLEVWESVGAEVRRLESGWRDGSGALRSALGLAVEKVEVRERVEEAEQEEEGSASADRDEVPQEVGDELNATGAVYATLDSSGTAVDDDLVSSRQAMLDAALSASLLPPPDSTDGVDSPSKEKVFEAVAGADVRASAGAKLSRDERIRRMKEAREALALGRSSLESPVKGAPGEGGGASGDAESQRSMVGELREVLKELNRDKGRADPPSSAPHAVDAAPPPRSIPAQSQPVTTPPPPAAKSLSPPPPPPIAQAPTARVSPLQPAYEQLPPPSPTKSIPSPTTQRVPPPPLARRLSQPPQAAPLLATPPRLPLPSPPTVATPPSAPLARPAAQYPSPAPLPPPVPAVPSTPGKQQAPRYVSPPPPSSAARARASSSTAFATFSPPGSAPATPGKQQVPRYVAPPPARATPPAPLLPSPRYSASSSSMGLGSPTGPLSPVRAAPQSPLRATAHETDEQRAREGSEHARAQGPPSAQQQQQSAPPPQRVKRPSVQTV
ncbi:hypothetical protein JCM9279_004060 [Rhodotorula babjevae]